MYFYRTFDAAVTFSWQRRTRTDGAHLPHLRYSFGERLARRFETRELADAQGHACVQEPSARDIWRQDRRPGLESVVETSHARSQSTVRCGSGTGPRLFLEGPNALRPFCAASVSRDARVRSEEDPTEPERAHLCEEAKDAQLPAGSRRAPSRWRRTFRSTPDGTQSRFPWQPPVSR